MCLSAITRWSILKCISYGLRGIRVSEFRNRFRLTPFVNDAILISASEAVATLESREVMKQTGATVDLVESDVLDHYRTYNLLEKLLQNPLKLAEQLSFQIEPQTQQLLIEKYVGIAFQVKFSGVKYFPCKYACNS